MAQAPGQLSQEATIASCSRVPVPSLHSWPPPANAAAVGNAVDGPPCAFLHRSVLVLQLAAYQFAPSLVTLGLPAALSVPRPQQRQSQAPRELAD